MASGGGGGRQTALALVLAIVASELVLSGHGQAAWRAIWGPVRGLGQEGDAPGTGGNGSVNSGGFPLGPGGNPDPNGGGNASPPVFTT